MGERVNVHVCLQVTHIAKAYLLRNPKSHTSKQVLLTPTKVLFLIKC